MQIDPVRIESNYKVPQTDFWLSLGVLDMDALFLYGLLLSLWWFSAFNELLFPCFLQLTGNFVCAGQNNSKYRE